MSDAHDRDLLRTILGLSGRFAALLQRSLTTRDYARGVLAEVLQVTRCDAVLLCLHGAERDDAGGAECHTLRQDGTFETTTEDEGHALVRCASAVPLEVAGEHLGALGFACGSGCHVSLADERLFESIGQTLAVSLALHASRSALRERVKELQCLYDMMQLVTVSGRSLEDILGGIAALLPRAWQYPEIAEARVVFDGRVYATPGFGAVVDVQSAEVTRGPVSRGRVEVGYRDGRPFVHEGPFLREERALLDTIAHDVGLIAERLEAQSRRERLEEQLRHADRLATIGKLAAGVAHELNEPLANVLGFAQLARKAPALPKQAASDIDRVVEASLHARDVIQRLLLFARQSPPQVAAVDVDDVVESVLAFFEKRWAQAGVRVIRALSVAPRPVVEADRGQLRQVLVNLLVNAAQAMPDGGQVTLRTRVRDEAVEIVVEDTGCGMSEAVRRQIFLPFFTTKDVNAGTGLGLSVVHGIVTAHGGVVEVESEEGRGSRFTVSLPAAPRPGAPGVGRSGDLGPHAADETGGGGE